MNDYLNNNTEAAPGGYLADDLSWGDPAPAAPSEDPWAQPIVDPPAGDSGDAWMSAPRASAAPAQHLDAGGELHVQPPMLEHMHPTINHVGGARDALSDLVLDVEVGVEVFLGDAALTVEEFLELGAGSVVELDHPVEHAVELRVRGKLVARGQLVTINGNYGLRITETAGGQ